MYLCFLKIILASICSVLEFWVVTAIQILKALASHMASPYRLVLSLESMVSDNSHMPPSQEFKRQATTMIFFPIKNYWQCQPWTEQEAPFYVVLPSLNQIINCLLLQTKNPIGWPWCCTPVVPSSWKAEARGLGVQCQERLWVVYMVILFVCLDGAGGVEGMIKWDRISL